jgi:hypothetical protein
MKIAILGSAPSSLGLAPFGDPSYRIWGCSPGVYATMARCDAWFELHRPEFGVIGKPHTQKQWFSPEYVAWMGMLKCPVWMHSPVPQIPASRALPIDDLKAKYGTYFLTSSLSIMIACAIDNILEARGVITSAAGGKFVGNTVEGEEDVIALYGVDMSATEEWGYQRAGCQYFLTLANMLGITIWVPPESDLLRPSPVYGLCENEWWHIKGTARRRELEARLAAATAGLEQCRSQVDFLKGCLDDHKYHMDTWGQDRDGVGPDISILAQSPELQAAVLRLQPPPAPVVEVPSNILQFPAAPAPKAPPKPKPRVKAKKRARR